MNKFKVKIPIPKSYLKEKYMEHLNGTLSNQDFAKLVQLEESGVSIEIGFEALDYWIFGNDNSQFSKFEKESKFTKVKYCTFCEKTWVHKEDVDITECPACGKPLTEKR